jgi:hypothetical protein
MSVPASSRRPGGPPMLAGDRTGSSQTRQCRSFPPASKRDERLMSRIKPHFSVSSIVSLYGTSNINSLFVGLDPQS